MLWTLMTLWCLYYTGANKLLLSLLYEHLLIKSRSGINKTMVQPHTVCWMLRSSWCTISVCWIKNPPQVLFVCVFIYRSRLYTSKSNRPFHMHAFTCLCFEHEPFLLISVSFRIISENWPVTFSDYVFPLKFLSLTCWWSMFTLVSYMTHTVIWLPTDSDVSGISSSLHLYLQRQIQQCFIPLICPAL